MIPSTNPTTAATGKVNSGSMPVAWAVNRPVYMPIIKNSPWAKLTISITPKMIVRPRATMARTMPNKSPATIELRRISISKNNYLEVSGVRFRVSGFRIQKTEEVRGPMRHLHSMGRIRHTEKKILIYHLSFVLWPLSSGH